MKKHKSYPYIIMAIIAVLILVISYFLRPQTVTWQDFLYDAVLNCGYIVITIVIVKGLWFFFGGGPEETAIRELSDGANLLSDGLSTGLNRFFLSNAEFSRLFMWADLLHGAKNKVDLMGYSLHAWTRSEKIKKIMIMLAKRNVQIRIMVMSTQNSYFDAGLNYGLNAFTRQVIEAEVALCRNFYESVSKELPEEKKNNIQFVEIKKGLVEAQIIRIDNDAYITPYLFSLNTDDSPLLKIQGKHTIDAFSKYCSEFEMLWQLNHHTEQGT